MNLEQIIKDFEHEEKWCNEQMDKHYKIYEESDYTYQSELEMYSKYSTIQQRVQFIKSEMESLLKLY